MKVPVRSFVCLLFLATATFAQESGKVFVVRHAEKQSDAEDTALSQKGRARAECLAQTLRDAHISTVLVSKYIRTQQTAAPVVRDSHARETTFDAKAYDQLVAAAKDSAKSGNVLVVGHSNTIPTLMTSFGAPAVTIPDTSYDLLFILDAGDPKNLLTLHYCPNLAREATSHSPGSMANH
jgi:hypothetical protein